MEFQLAGLMVELLVILMASQLAAMMGRLWALLKASLKIDVQENKQTCEFINGPTSFALRYIGHFRGKVVAETNYLGLIRSIVPDVLIPTSYS